MPTIILYSQAHSQQDDTEMEVDALGFGENASKPETETERYVTDENAFATITSPNRFGKSANSPTRGLSLSPTRQGLGRSQVRSPLPAGKGEVESSGGEIGLSASMLASM